MKSYFGKVSDDEEVMLLSFFNNMDEYKNVGELTYSELVEQFGKPEDVFCTYVGHSNDSVFVQKQLYLKRKKQYLILSILVVIIVLTTFIWKAYENSRQSYINREEVEIIQDY